MTLADATDLPEGPEDDMLGLPAPTEFDLKFRLLGVPVRVHPLFWVLAAALGWDSHDRFDVLAWIACVFVSIVVHEFGHALTARALSGQRPSVVLYAMGGLCTTDRDDRSPGRRIAMILMGPGAGFLLFGLVGALGTALIGVDPLVALDFAPPRLVHQPPRWATSLVQHVYRDLLWINLYWGAFNLLPIYPLDGGQVAQSLLQMQNRREGARRGFILSMVTAGLLAIYLFQREQTYNAVFVGYLGLINFQFLQAAHEQARYGEGDDDDGWWRR